MNNIIKHFTYNNLQVYITKVIQNPRFYSFNFGKFILNNDIHYKYALTEQPNNNFVFSKADIPLLNQLYQYYIPLFFNNNKFQILQYIPKTTSNQIGWYVVSKQNLNYFCEYYDSKTYNGQLETRLFQILQYEIELYNAFRHNILYNYKIIDHKTQIIDETINIGLNQIPGIPDNWLYN